MAIPQFIRRAAIHSVGMGLRAFGRVMISKSEIRALKQGNHRYRLLDFLDREYPSSLSLEQAMDIVEKSKSENGQDIFALTAAAMKRRGFFVEFGATNGVNGSNTYLLEKEFGWEGILAEPAGSYLPELRTNRSASVEHKAVWSQSDEQVLFLEENVRELSTVVSAKPQDGHRRGNRKSKEYFVETISLLDLLDRNDAPKHIDFLSVDTEGSEFEILSAFDFSEYQFTAICVEHNHTSLRDEIWQLLSRNGYRRVHEKFSNFDDWYLHEDD